MEIEPHPDKPNKKALVTVEDNDEARLLADAMMPRILFRYYRQWQALRDLDASYPFRISLTNGQLGWINQRLKPWEEHIQARGDHDDVELAHHMATTISNHLDRS